MISPHGDCRHGGGSDGARADVLAHQAEHPLACPTPKPSPDLAVAPSIGLRPPPAPGPHRRRLLGVLAGGHGLPQAAQTRRRPLPGEVAALAATSGPKGTPSWPPAVPPAWSTLRSASWRYPVPPAPELLERGVDPADRFLTPLLERKISRPTGATEVAPQNDLTLARHRPLAKSQRACRQKRGRAKLARIYHRPSGHVPVLLGHFD